ETQNVFLAPLIQDLALTHQTAGLEKLALLLDVLHQPTHEDVLSCFAGICAMRDNLRGVELPDPSAQSSDQDTKAESGAPEAKAESADPVADPASPEDAPDELAAHDNELEEDSELTVGVGAEATALEEFSLGDFRKKAVAAFKRNAAMTQIYQDGRKVELPLAWSDRARLFNKLSVAIFQHLKNNEKITSYARSELEKRLRFAQKYDTTAVERLTQYLAEINAISKAPEQIKTELAELNSKLRDGRMLSALQLFMIVKEIDERLSHTAEKDFNTRGQLFFSGYALLNVYACLYKPGPRVPENVVINNPNETRLTQMNCTLLMLAVQQKHSRLVSILCQKTAQFSEAGDPNLQDARGNTLFKRIQTNDVETLKIILNSERLAPETINQRGSKSEKSRLKVALENKEREVA
ncbi:MAG: ankyrin repeat domain-containing protein, partial [Gammaproteobacteria bacterium]|nr:ankyrin repeat domain-containing protein [Gammaproteobacteria bacterium]